ncbi:hypothetical protein [Abditibacterium utsteinense]|nr:hypothetical protein [Abditibacterium utsteinense]
MKSFKSYLCAALAVGAATSALSAAHAAPTSPTSIGFAGALPDFKSVDLETRHVYDYTFASAPTDWKIASGVWEMTNRWSCSPGWSWFGGRSDETAAIWNKRKLAGDVSAQVYFAFKMGMTGVDSWPEYPADAALTILGDGKNLGTGYTFIAGADDNTHSVLMKNGVVVASSSAPAAVLPRLSDGNPGNDAMHRRWWFSRVDKSGSKISCYIDDKLVLSYDDAAPLKSGQTAVWTYNNGLMLARVQLYYQQEIRPVYTKTILAKAAPKPVPARSKAAPRLAKALK